MGWALDDLPERYRRQVIEQLPRGTKPPRLSEQAFQERVIYAARALDWLVFHDHDSRRSEPGFPDLVLVRAGRLIFAELKRSQGRLSEAQQRWLARLRATGAEVYEWRPEDWDRVLEVLR